METRCSKPPTETEWQVMECVWEKAPCTGREVWEWFQGRTTWSRSTPLTEQKRGSAKEELDQLYELLKGLEDEDHA